VDRSAALTREIDVQRASRILADLAGWQADRSEPPSLRDGYVCPSVEAIDWARAVLALEVKP